MFPETIKLTNSLYFYTGDNVGKLISLGKYGHCRKPQFITKIRIKKIFWRFMKVQNNPPRKN